MERDPRAFLWDVQQAVVAIQEFTHGMDSTSYADSALVRSAVERQFEIIGEALNRLSKAAPDLAQEVPNLREIIGFRNILIHGYASVDHGRVWQISVELAPKLKLAVSALLERLGSD
jgi:uncharacterized protein with HEPN domain